jgi:hypothetical protein
MAYATSNICQAVVSVQIIEHARFRLLGSIGLMNSSDSVCRILAPSTRPENTLCPSRPFEFQQGVVAGLAQCLHIGANDITNPADFGVVVDFVDAGLFLVKTILQGFDCDIESDFVPKFETVGDGLRG